MMCRLRAIVLPCGLALALASCSGYRHGLPRGRALALVTIDTLRADRLGAGGDPRARTPHLDRMARRGTQWACAVSPVPLTLPSHATILSGRTPPEHGARDNGLYRVGDEVPLVPASLHAAGYQTAAFLAAYPLAARFGLARGFEAYHDALGLRKEGSAAAFAERSANKVNDDVLAWLEDRGTDERPLFLWIHYFDPHAPYEPPRIWSSATAKDPYRGEVAFTDDRLGRLGRRLASRFHDVRLVVVGDHGESLGEHDEDTHGVFVYDSTIRVPLLASGRGVPVGRLANGAVSTTRIASTLLALAGIDSDEGEYPEPSLMAPDQVTKPLYVESMYPQLRHGWAPLTGLRTERWKVIRAPQPEVYDLERDPGEQRNLYGSQAVSSEAELLLAELDARGVELDPPGKADPQVEEALHSLGYASSRTEAVSGDLPDPKGRVRLERILGNAGGALEAGQFDAARSALYAARGVEPQNKETWILSARLEAATGAMDRAMDTLDRCLTLPPASMNALVHYTAGGIELAAGRFDSAEARFAASVELDPLNVDARYNWGLAAYRRGDWAAAVARWRSVLELDPDHPLAKQWLPDAERKQHMVEHL